MEAIVTAITTGLTPTVMFGTVANLVPIILLLVPVSLGVYFLRKLVKGAGKAKIRF